MDVFLGFVVLIGLFALYLLPGIVAHKRRHPNETAILVLNLLLGWTLLGWVGALVWACTNQSPIVRMPQPHRSFEQYFAEEL